MSREYVARVQQCERPIREERIEPLCILATSGDDGGGGRRSEARVGGGIGDNIGGSIGGSIGGGIGRVSGGGAVVPTMATVAVSATRARAADTVASHGRALDKLLTASSDHDFCTLFVPCDTCLERLSLFDLVDLDAFLCHHACVQRYDSLADGAVLRTLVGIDHRVSVVNNSLRVGTSLVSNPVALRTRGGVRVFVIQNPFFSVRVDPVPRGPQGVVTDGVMLTARARVRGCWRHGASLAIGMLTEEDSWVLLCLTRADGQNGKDLVELECEAALVRVPSASWRVMLMVRDEQGAVAVTATLS